MHKIVRKLSVFLFIISPIASIQSQISKGNLSKGQLITAEIHPNEKHSFDLNLDKDQFVLLKLMQRGVDMKISTFDTNGKKID